MPDQAVIEEGDREGDQTDPFTSDLALAVNARLNGHLEHVLRVLKIAGYSVRDVAKVLSLGTEIESLWPSRETVRKWYRWLDREVG